MKRRERRLTGSALVGQSCDGSSEKSETTAVNVHAGHRERLKKRFLSEGLGTFETHNVLELLLFYSNPQKDVNGLAHELINRFGSLGNVFDAEYEELITLNGVKDHTATLLKLIPALSQIYYDEMFSAGQSRSKFDIDSIKEHLIRLFAGKKNEEVYLLTFDSDDSLKNTIFLQRGSLSYTAVETRNLVQTALRAGYEKIALAHNHPDGSAFPSMEDIETSERLKRGLDFCGLKLCEHFIVAGNQCIGMYDWERTRLLEEKVKTGLKENSKINSR